MSKNLPAAARPRYLLLLAVGAAGSVATIAMSPLLSAALGAVVASWADASTQGDRLGFLGALLGAGSTIFAGAIAFHAAWRTIRLQSLQIEMVRQDEREKRQSARKAVMSNINVLQYATRRNLDHIQTLHPVGKIYPFFLMPLPTVVEPVTNALGMPDPGIASAVQIDEEVKKFNNTLSHAQARVEHGANRLGRSGTVQWLHDIDRRSVVAQETIRREVDAFAAQHPGR
ncbi:hypothetical protein LGR54_19250 [Ancylobacter sp. Lp-2]|uniref:hypothetical protein n=1 Tax=Ancylobacter sp. Lp-2 TaxID=2881339 RepID=UPI001E509C32|nr:hypothetical protein [Ancylobacter sp. Lp-2]MCB4770752.1 hypothetical protein [Ancylobacter sp. Lp-2]